MVLVESVHLMFKRIGIATTLRCGCFHHDGRIVSSDERDFHAYRWKNQHPFCNLWLAQDQ